MIPKRFRFGVIVSDFECAAILVVVAMLCFGSYWVGAQGIARGESPPVNIMQVADAVEPTEEIAQPFPPLPVPGEMEVFHGNQAFDGATVTLIAGGKKISKTFVPLAWYKEGYAESAMTFPNVIPENGFYLKVSRGDAVIAAFSMPSSDIDFGKVQLMVFDGAIPALHPSQSDWYIWPIRKESGPAW